MNRKLRNRIRRKMARAEFGHTCLWRILDNFTIPYVMGRER